MNICLECNQSFNSISKHIKKHRISLENYTLKWTYNNIHPVCQCGCGAETEWIESRKDFNAKIEAHGGFAPTNRTYTKRQSCEWDKQCLICKATFSSRKGTSYHIRNAHGLDYEAYLIIFKYDGKKPLCKCGCGNFVDYMHGVYNLYYKNHFSNDRVITEKFRKRTSIKSTGRRHTNEWKMQRSKEMYALHKETDKLRVAVSKANKGKICTPEHRERISKTRKERIASGDIVINREAISKTITNMHMSGQIEYVQGTYTRKNGSTIGYRSSWELLYAQYLDNDPNVKEWLFEKKFIQYEFEGHMHRYLPDFIVHYNDGSTYMVEVKPIKLSTTPKIVQKAIYATEYCKKKGWGYLFASFESGELEYY